MRGRRVRGSRTILGSARALVRSLLGRDLEERVLVVSLAISLIVLVSVAVKIVELLGGDQVTGTIGMLLALVIFLALSLAAAALR